MAQKSINDIYRQNYYVESDISYLRMVEFSLADDGSISTLAIPDLIRRSYYDDGTNTYLRVIKDASSDNPAIHDEIITSDITIATGKQYLIHGALTIDESVIVDGNIVVI